MNEYITYGQRTFLIITSKAGIKSYWAIDTKHKESVSKFHWHISGCYVRASDQITILHRYIYSLEYGDTPSVVDHVNGIKRDNTIKNLAKSTDKKNKQNQHLGFCPQHYAKKKKNNSYIAMTSDGNGSKFEVGTFDSKAEAANAGHLAFWFTCSGKNKDFIIKYIRNAGFKTWTKKTRSSKRTLVEMEYPHAYL